MSTTSFFDNDADLITKALSGLTTINTSLRLDISNKIVYRSTGSKDSTSKVSIVSGGGSGHEPGFAGLVGKGLLTASVCGTIFASPSAEQIRQALLTRVPVEKGVLVLTMNYTGDVLNFGIATEKAKSCGVPTRFLVVGDDVGVGRVKAGKVGRRGIAGTTLVVKILGALAEQGATLDEVYELGQLLSRNIVSVGASLQRVQIPGRPGINPEYQIPIGEVEIGMGIHNEAGCRRMPRDLPQLVSVMLSQLLDPSDLDRNFVSITSSDQVVLLINNLGGLSPLEIAAITFEVCHQAKVRYGVEPVRVLSGTFLTSLNCLGWSATFLKVTPTGLGPGKSILDLLDAPAEASGWPTSIKPDGSLGSQSSLNGTIGRTFPEVASSNLYLQPKQAIAFLSGGLEELIAAEPEVTRFDSIVGDGDCGVGLKRGASAVLKELSEGKPFSEDAIVFVSRLVAVIENTMDGTAGAIFMIFTNALIFGLQQQDDGSKRSVDTKIWATALQSALDTLGTYTPAKVGDRTFLDSLTPFVEVLAATGDLLLAGKASVEGAERTKTLKASLGRTVYVGQHDAWLGKIPDPGAWGLSKFLMGLGKTCSG